MDRQTERKQRINEGLLPLAKKLQEDKKEYPTWDHVKWELVRYAKRTWLLSDPVARDYADLALIILRQ